MEKKSNTYLGVGFSGLLTIVFIVLKLVGVINWSWVWVLSPMWINAILMCSIMIIAFIIGLKIMK